MGRWLVARLRSFRHALAGLVFLVRTERNAQVHLVVTLGVLVAGVWLDVSRGDWLWLIAAMALVWIAEAVNTAIETLCDVVSPEHNKMIGAVKDVAAGGVLVAAVAAVLIGAAIFWPYLTFRI